MIDETKAIDFKAIRLKLASPEKILDWSHGEITRPETINYRTQKPEKDGLFCERIFGPSKDWECYCGKYKRIRYKGIVCDKCGVEVTRSIVRRERMGHIKLSAPVSHIWFLRGVPSKIGLVLGLSIQDLEKVIYFANFIVTQVDEELKKETLDQISKEYSAKVKSIEENYSQRANKIKQNKVEQLAKEAKEGEKKKIEERINQEIFANAEAKNEELRNLEETVTLARKELKELKPKLIISENRYQDLSLKYGHIFEAGIGAEAIHKLLKEIDLDKTIKELEKETIGAPENKRKRVSRRLRLLKNLKKNGIRPDWMVISIIPVIPPDLRPMVQLDGGRFATSDLNDLYRRVINRNNRLKKLIELNAPEVICRNEKRMLQEAVDALIDNGARRGKTVTASTGQKRMLKSIADILKGKQGRFRQNLLGKRVDYSGRSVIVIGPNLKLDECGLPKRMALELFRPFVISQLIKREYVHNVRSAGRFIETGRSEVWDILEEVTKNAHVMLNRAPTLHRLGIQAFKPKLIEGKAIQIHPLVCSAFNADFDGDQMAVHLPLTEQAKEEAKNLMLSTNNLLKPATGAPVTTPSQDIVLGCYYLTLEEEEKKDKLKNFSSREEALLAYHSESIKIHEPIMVPEKSKLIKTTPGRLIFNSILPKELQYINKVLDKKALSAIVTDSLTRLGQEKTAQILDDIKKLSFEYLTQSGISWGMDDLPEVKKKNELIKQAEAKVEEIEQHYNAGLLTDKERQVKVIETWAKIKEEIQEVCRQSLDKSGPVYTMIESGSRGSWGQITQMMGMKGLVTNPAGETIELPVKGSFKDGFDVLEYFISTHGARKGLSDTALRTANAGYLTRRLIDVSQEVVVNEKDCKDNEGFIIKKEEAEETGDSLAKRVWGRVLMDDILDKKTKKVAVKKGILVDEETTKLVEKADPDQVRIRSVLSCKARRGICQKCYGFDLGYNKLVELGTAIGIIAAQSIGEPGTQLTMRTFHTGGVAGQDITQGLPRVEELFEARPVKKAAIISEVDGTVSISEVNDNKLIKVNYIEDREEVLFENKSKLNPEFIKVKDGQKVKKQAIVYEDKKKEIKAPQEGNIKLEDNKISLIYKKEAVKEYSPPVGYSLWVKEGDLVTKGQSLTEGSINLFDIFRLSGIEATQKYIMKEIQYIYSSQGQKLNDKHVEVIVRQMFSRVLVKNAGETELLSGEIVDRNTAEIANKEAEKKGAKKAILEPMLLGITKASLTTDSFLSAASFQETARVLIDAAITGKVDKLRGLKENVIIGKLIPAGTGYKKSE